MRSATLVSLEAFGQFLGVDPYLLAQVDYNGENIPRLKDGWCDVFVEYPWQRAPNPNDSEQMGFLSRASLRRALTQAESIFYQWTRLYPAPTQILSEYHDHTHVHTAHTVAMMLKPTVQEVIAPGVWTYTGVPENSVALVKGSINDTFTATFTVPAGTQAADVFVYVSGETPTLANEYRPVEITINGTTGTLSAPAYLFVKQSLYELHEPARLPHHEDTYVDTVDIYIRGVDRCQHGTIEFRETALANLPSSTGGLYLTLKKKRHNVYMTPQAIACDESDELSRYTITKAINGYHINYIAGYALNNRRVQPQLRDIICKMATALLPFDFTDNEWDRRYNCNGEFKPTVQLYQMIPAVESQGPTRLSSGQINGPRYQTVVPKHVMDRLNGLSPMKGIVDAFHDCTTLGILRI